MYNTNPMWGGVFTQGPAELMKQINQSISVDKKLYAEDIAGSIAHAQMLGKQCIISSDEAAKIIEGLKQIKIEIEAGQFKFKEELEDIHMNIEARLTEIIGETAGKLHTARSRNDQVATDLKLYVRTKLVLLGEVLKELQISLVKKAEKHIDTIMPGFTHFQSAQPISFAHYLMAYVEMLGRDSTRVKDCIERLNECPLGSAALAGTSFPIDRDFTAELLGFDRPTRNSIDSVSDRDFALEFLFVASMISLHLSRLAEEIIVFSNSRFNFIKLSENYSSGSSIMPQKRNPDSAELIRAQTGKIFGNLTALFMIMKALPLAYNKDMQEDKLPIFESAETILLISKLMAGMIDEIEVNKEVMLKAANEGFSTATDIADWLVKNTNMPFRQGHHITGQIVKLAEKKNCKLQELSIEEIKIIVPEASEDLLDALDVLNSVTRRNSYGGTAPDKIKEAILRAKKILGL